MDVVEKIPRSEWRSLFDAAAFALCAGEGEFREAGKRGLCAERAKKTTPSS